MGTCCCNCGGTTPPGTWGGAGEPFPTPPIYIPGDGNRPPLWLWGGSNEPFPTPPIANAPGIPGFSPYPPYPAHPIYWPNPHPEHPIVLPPTEPDPPPDGFKPVDPGYQPPANTGENYFLAMPASVLPTGPTAYLVMPIWAEVQHLPAPPGGS